MQKEIKRIIYMLNCQQDPIVYNFNACYLIYQCQKYDIKKFNFLPELLFNLLSKLTPDEYNRNERYYSVFFRMFFRYVEVIADPKLNEELFNRCSISRSKLLMI